MDTTFSMTRKTFNAATLLGNHDENKLYMNVSMGTIPIVKTVYMKFSDGEYRTEFESSALFYDAITFSDDALFEVEKEDGMSAVTSMLLDFEDFDSFDDVTYQIPYNARIAASMATEDIEITMVPNDFSGFPIMEIVVIVDGTAITFRGLPIKEDEGFLEDIEDTCCGDEHSECAEAFPGDKVMIIKKSTNFGNPCRIWNPDMDESINKTGVVLRAKDDYEINLDDGSDTWWFPRDSFTLILED